MFQSTERLHPNSDNHIPPPSQTTTLSKWPLKPGVHVHVNSLTTLADESKPLYNNNTLSKGSSGPAPNTIALGSSEQVNRHHLNYIQALNQQKLYPSTTLDKRSSSSSSSNSSASSSSNLINPRKNQTLPRSLEIETYNKSGRKRTHNIKPLTKRGETDYESSATRYYHTGSRPNSAIENNPLESNDDEGTLVNKKIFERI